MCRAFLWVFMEEFGLLEIEAFAQLGRCEWAGFGGAWKEAVADAGDSVVGGIADGSRDAGAGDGDEAPEAAQAVENMEDGGGAAQDLAVFGGDDDAVGQCFARDSGVLEGGIEGFALDGGEAEGVIAGVFGQDQADPALTKTTRSIVEHPVGGVRFFAGNPAGVKGEQVDEEHADAQVGEGDGGQDAEVEADEAEPEPGAQAGDEGEWEREDFEAKRGPGD